MKKEQVDLILEKCASAYLNKELTQEDLFKFMDIMNHIKVAAELADNKEEFLKLAAANNALPRLFEGFELLTRGPRQKIRNTVTNLSGKAQNLMSSKPSATKPSSLNRFGQNTIQDGLVFRSTAKPK
jgi:hypothetical protein